MRSNIKVEQGGWINSIHSKVTVIGLGLSLSALAFALGAPTTTRIFSGSEVAADSLPPAQPFASPSVVTSSDPTNPLLSACQLIGTAPYTVNVNGTYNLANCFNPHPSGQSPTFSSSTCNGLSADGTLSPSTQVASCYVSAQVPASGNSLASSVVTLDLSIAGPLQVQPALTAFDESSVQWNANTFNFSTFISNWQGTGGRSWSSSTPTICSVDASTGLVTKLADGPCSLSASVTTDGVYSATSQVFSFTSSFYQPPTLDSALSDASVGAYSPFSLDLADRISFANDDGSLSYTLSTSPSWLEISSTGRISGRPALSDTGGTVTVQVDDGQGFANSIQSYSFDLTVTASPTSDLFAAYSSTVNPDYDIASWPATNTGVTYNNMGARVETDRLAFFYTKGTAQNTVSNRRSFNDVLMTLGATNLADGVFDSAGLTDNNGDLLTIALGSGDTGGYLIIGVGERTESGYQHGLLHLRPLPAPAVTTTIGPGYPGEAFYLPTNPYGVVSGNAANAAGSVVITGGSTVGDTITADISGLSDPDGFNASDATYQWLRDGQAITGATGASYRLSGTDDGGAITVRVSYIDGSGFSEVIVSTTGVTASFPSGLDSNGRLALAISGGGTADAATLQDALALASPADTDNTFGDLSSLTESEVGYLNACLSGSDGSGAVLTTCVDDATPASLASFEIVDNILDGDSTLSDLTVSQLTTAGLSGVTTDGGVSGQSILNFLNSSVCGSTEDQSCSMALDAVNEVTGARPMRTSGEDVIDELLEYVAAAAATHSLNGVQRSAAYRTSGTINACEAAPAGNQNPSSLNVAFPPGCGNGLWTCSATSLSGHSVTTAANGRSATVTRTRTQVGQEVRLSITMDHHPRYGIGAHTVTKTVSAVLDNPGDNWATAFSYSLGRGGSSDTYICDALAACLGAGGRIPNYEQRGSVTDAISGSNKDYVFPSGSGWTTASNWPSVTSATMDRSNHGGNDWWSWSNHGRAGTHSNTFCPGGKQLSGTASNSFAPAATNYVNSDGDTVSLSGVTAPFVANIKMICQLPRCN